MKQHLNQTLPVQNDSERQEILKQAFLLSESGSIRDIYATTRKICAHKNYPQTFPFSQKTR